MNFGGCSHALLFELAVSYPDVFSVQNIIQLDSYDLYLFP